MKMVFRTLKLICRKREEVVDLSAHISFFHGRLSAGKSTIARLIDFCLGGSLEQTTAIQQEFVAAQLNLYIGAADVLIERNQKENFLQVSWVKPGQEPYSVLVAAKGDGAEVLPGIRNMSDLILHLLGVPVIKVRTRTDDASSPLARLSMRDIFKFCYLPQEELDSSFFQLSAPILREKSKDVLNYVLGFFSDELSTLLIEFDTVSSDQRTKLSAAKKISTFLAQFDLGSESDIDRELAVISRELASLDIQSRSANASFQHETHFADEQRAELRSISHTLAMEEEAMEDMQRRYEEQRELRSELISMKFKTARTDLARKVLAGAKFISCPRCGESLDQHRAEGEECYVCLQSLSPIKEGEHLSSDIVRADLDARIAEVDSYLRRQEKLVEAQRQKLSGLKGKKGLMDGALAELLANYESDRIARTRDADRKRATLEERSRFLEKLRAMPDAVRKMEEEADSLAGQLQAIQRDIDREKARLAEADKNFSLLEEYYLDALVTIGLPGVTSRDVVRINRRTLIPEILVDGRETLTYNFFTAGSGGKKVLMTICFALALHRVAAVRNLPLPTFLIVDSPTKNITPDINPELVTAFYRYLYGLAESDLDGTQFIIIDQSLARPSPGSSLKFHERLMQSGDPNHPPLISYYEGP